jgi:ribonuclease HII
MTSCDRTVGEIRALVADAHGASLTRLLDQLADDERSGVRAVCSAAVAREEAAHREAQRTRKLYVLQRTLAEQGFALVAGVDEVGRGALAGPLTVGAVILPLSPRLEGLDDSKRLTPARREELAALVRERAVCVSIAHVNAEEIDDMGVTAALKRAVVLALSGLDCVPDHVVLDGLPLRVVENETAVVKGDSKVASIAAASIVAKVARDAIMREIAPSFLQYGFDGNKGYGSADHLEAIARFGPSAVHRRSFCAGGGTIRLF